MEQQELNEVKKKLYKSKPKASFSCATKSGLLYTAGVEEVRVMFLIPLSELGDSMFEPEMESQLLVRYINTVLK